MINWSRDFGHSKFCVYDSCPSDIDFYQVEQVHGDVIIKVSGSNIVSADGMISLKSQYPLALGIKTADCLPVYYFGKEGSAFIHAGWRGVKDKILISEKLLEIDPQFVFIGPHIEPCCYQVQEDFLNNFPGSSFFYRRDGKIFFDLAGQAQSQLKEKFVGTTIENCGQCTCCNEKFHSYRRNQTKCRNWNIVEIRK